MEVGKWYRCGNAISYIFDLRKDKNGKIIDYGLRFSNGEKRYYTHTTGFKVANTPQELVQEGDLVYPHCYITPREVYSVSNNRKTYEYIEDDYIEDETKNITKILTPNSNGGYDLQYEKENDDELKARNQD